MGAERTVVVAATALIVTSTSSAAPLPSSSNCSLPMAALNCSMDSSMQQANDAPRRVTAELLVVGLLVCAALVFAIEFFTRRGDKRQDRRAQNTNTGACEQTVCQVFPAKQSTKQSTKRVKLQESPAVEIPACPSSSGRGRAQA
mmetsp:Transcript_3795/g.8255  ORF Transcript_3795/g.8255 Transcript_3795/m.8255 type:complete len:144 (-) Transcript_3795:550-981(-)